MVIVQSNAGVLWSCIKCKGNKRNREDNSPGLLRDVIDTEQKIQILGKLKTICR